MRAGKYPETLYLGRTVDRDNPNSYLESIGSTPEECAELNQVVEVAVYEFKKMVKIKTVVSLED